MASRTLPGLTSGAMVKDAISMAGSADLTVIEVSSVPGSQSGSLDGKSWPKQRLSWVLRVWSPAQWVARMRNQVWLVG